MMRQYTILDQYNLVKINSSPEIWLKSRKVKMRMIKTLMKNIKKALNRSGIPFHKYQLSKDSTRILFFFNNQNIQNAIAVIENVFGIDSISPALRTSNKLKNIIQRTIEISKDILEKNDSFAIRVKRSGRHEYTSQDVAVKMGKAILDNFSDLNLKVNLSNPKKRIFIEIRGEFSYIFTDIIKSQWSGLPIEKNKKILCMDVGRINDLLAGFLLMRRGCEVYPILFKLTNNTNSLEVWKSNWDKILKYTPYLKFKIRIINLLPILDKVKKDLPDINYLCAFCRFIRFEFLSKILKSLPIRDFERIKAFSDGITLNNTTFCFDEIDLKSISLNYLFSEYPIFTPLIGSDMEYINQIRFKISKNLKDLDYCLFKPNNQEIEKENLIKIYKSLNLKGLISEALQNIEEVNII